MIDRVAEALYVGEGLGPRQTWDEIQSDAWRRPYRNLAYVALRAMREPTPEMLARADDGYDGPSQGEIKEIWQDMIDEALK